MDNFCISLRKIIIIFIIALFGTILYFFNPENSIWFPKCPIFVITGLECPGCGIQRAAYHLLHFRFVEAFCYNPFLLIFIPYALLLIGVTWIIPENRAIGLRRFCVHPITVRVYIILTIIWFIVRNL